MTRNFATSVGMLSLCVLAVLGVNAVQAAAGSSAAFPMPLVGIGLVCAAVLANAWFTYKIVRGTRPDPAYEMDELREMVEEAAREAVRDEIEKLAVRMTQLGMAIQAQNEISPIPRPRPAAVVNLHRGD